MDQGVFYDSEKDTNLRIEFLGILKFQEKTTRGYLNESKEKQNEFEKESSNDVLQFAYDCYVTHYIAQSRFILKIRMRQLSTWLNG